MTRNQKKINKSYSLSFVILALIIVITMFIPFAKLHTIDENGYTDVETYSIVSLISESDDLQAKHELNSFSGLAVIDESAEVVEYTGEHVNILSSLNVLYGLFLLAVLLLITAFLKPSYIKICLYLLSSFVLAMVPIYVLTVFSGAKEIIVGLEKFSLTFAGFLLPFASGLMLLLTSFRYISFTRKLSQNTDTNDSVLKVIYCLLSIIIFAAFFFPMFTLDIKTGLTKTVTYSYTPLSYFSTIDNINVSAVFNSFKETQNIGWLKVFIIIPILCIASIIGLLLNKKRITKLLLVLQSIAAMALVFATITILKTNVEMFEKTARIATSFGGILMVAASLVTLIMLFINHPSRQIPYEVERSRKVHNLQYGILAAVTASILVTPQFGVLVKTAKQLQMINGTFNAGIRVPYSMLRVFTATNSAFSFLIFLAIISLIMVGVGLVLRQYQITKGAALATGLLMLLSYFISYAMLSAILGEEGTVQVRVSGMLLIIVSIMFIVLSVTDKNERVALTNAKKKVSQIFKYVALIGFLIVQLYPLIWMVLASFMTTPEVYSGKVLALPNKWMFSNYSRAVVSTRYDETLRDAVTRIFGEATNTNIFKYIIGATSSGNIVRAFGNSFYVVVITLIIIVLFSAMAAYALSRIKFKGNNLMYIVFVLGMMIPIHIALAPLYIAFSKAGLIDTYWSLIIPYAGFGFSLAIIVLYGFMKGIPYEIEEAAAIDGAGRIRTFFQLILPISMPALSTVAIFSFLGSWNELMFASLFIETRAKYTVTIAVYYMSTAQYRTDYGLLLAGLVIASLPTLIYYLLASEQVQKSLVQGSVKG